MKSVSNEVVWTQYIGGTLDFMDSMNLIKDAVKKDGRLRKKYRVKDFHSCLYGTRQGAGNL